MCPTRTAQIYHDVDSESSKPVKQQLYRLNPTKQQTVKEEIQYLLDWLIEPSQSDWSSCILVPKLDEKAIIRNRYNRIPLPSPDTMPKRNKNHDSIK